MPSVSQLMVAAGKGLPPENPIDAEERFRLVAMSTNDGIWDWNIATGQVYYSPRWLEFVGAAPGELPGHIDTFTARLHPDDADNVARSLQSYLSACIDDYNVEFRLRHSDGSWRWILSRGAALRNADGIATRLVGTHTEITGQVEAAERLERLVQERTSDLRAARDRAELAAAATTKFLATTSHDVRQPMQAMALLLPTLRREISGAAGRRVVDAMERSLSASMDLLETLLEYSRLDAGAMRPSITEVHLGALIDGIVESFQPEARQRGLMLRLRPSDLLVRSDPRLLGRILRNIIANALKYTERGGVLVGVRRAGDAVRIEIWDTGCGIDHDGQRRIFWEFIQLGGQRGGRSGLGLGLAIVDRLARLLGHRVTVRSRVGSGSVFSIGISGSVPASAAAASPVARPAGLGDGPCLVAVLDDDGDIAAALARLLEDWGCTVVHASTTAAMLDRIGGRVPDLVIADWHLDDGDDGFTAFAALDALAGRRLPGVILTGDYDLALLERTNVDRRKVLHKPVSPDVLHAVLRGELAQGQSR